MPWQRIFFLLSDFGLISTFSGEIFSESFINILVKTKSGKIGWFTESSFCHDIKHIVIDFYEQNEYQITKGSREFFRSVKAFFGTNIPEKWWSYRIFDFFVSQPFWCYPTIVLTPNLDYLSAISPFYYFDPPATLIVPARIGTFFIFYLCFCARRKS